MLSEFNPMDLQFFAEGSGADTTQSSSADVQGSEAGNTESSESESTNSSESTGEAKYTQADMNKAMANKDAEITAKVKDSLKSDFKVATQSAVSSALAYGAKRAKMTDDQKKADDQRRSESAAKSMRAELASYKANEIRTAAVSNATTALTSAGVMNAGSVANFIADSDPSKAKSKASAFIEWYANTTDGVKKRALSPNANPNASSRNLPGQLDTKKDPNAMTASEFVAYQLKQRGQK